MNDVDDGRTGTAQHNGQWPAKVLINILCPVHTHTHTHTLSHARTYQSRQWLCLCFMKVALCANLLGHKHRKTATTFGKCFASPPPSPSSLFTALSNCANSPNSWVLCAFLCYYYAMLSCAFSHSPRRKLPVFNLANARSLASRSWSRSSESKIYPIYPLPMSVLPAILSFVQLPSLLAIFPSANQLCLYFPIQRQRATIIS